MKDKLKKEFEEKYTEVWNGNGKRRFVVYSEEVWQFIEQSITEAYAEGYYERGIHDTQILRTEIEKLISEAVKERDREWEKKLKKEDWVIRIKT